MRHAAFLLMLLLLLPLFTGCSALISLPQLVQVEETATTKNV